MASKGIAAVLNLLFWGAGYIYLGKKKTLGVGLVISSLVMHLPLLYMGIESFMTVPGIYMLVGHLVLSFTTAYDVLK